MKKNTTDKVTESIFEHYDYAKSHNYNIVALFLQGSQNYGLETHLSDVDTKAILLPSFKSIITQSKKTSTTLVLPNNEHCDVKDISCMYECFIKSNINFLEILFTEFKIINSKYKQEITELCANAEDIALYDYKRLVNSIIGMACEKRKALTHPYPATIEKIEKYGYDGKQLHHILRLSEFLDRLEAGESFKNCLRSKQASVLNTIKIDPEFTVDEAIQVADAYVEHLKDHRENSIRYKESVQNQDVKEFLNDSLYKIMKKSVENELINKGDI